MNLAIRIDEVEELKDVVVLRSTRQKRFYIYGKRVSNDDLIILDKRDIPYVQNMLLKEEYKLYSIRRGANEDDQNHGEHAIRLSELSSSFRDEVRKKDPYARDGDFVFLTQYNQ